MKKNNFLIKNNIGSLGRLLFLCLFFFVLVSLSYASANINKEEYKIKKSKADAYFDKADYKNAVKLYNNLLTYSKYFDFRDSVDILLNLGISNYYNGDYTNSLNFFKIVQPLIENDKKEEELYIFGSFYLGMNYYKLAKYNDALITFDNIEKFLFNKNNSNINNFINLYNNKALIYQSIGDFNNALQFYEKSLNYPNKGDIEDCYSYSGICMNLGVLYIRQKKYSKAIFNLKKGIELQEKLDIRALANAYNAYAIALKKTGNYKEAEKYYLKAIDNRLKYGYMMGELSKDYHNYAELLIAQKRYNKAIDYLKKAHNEYLKYYGTYSTHTAMCLNSFTDFYIQTNNFSKALEYSQKAIISSTNNFNDINIFSNPSAAQSLSRLETLKALKNKAQVMYQVYNQDPSKNFTYLESSLETYNTAVEIIEQIRLNYFSDESKMYLTEQEKPTYVSAIEVAEKLYRITNDPQYIEKAFVYAEKSKATTLLANIRNNDAMEFGNIPLYIRNIEKELKKNIVFEEKLLQRLISDNQVNKKEITESQNKLFDLRQKLDYFYKYLDNNYKEYYEIKYNQRYATIKDIQRRLKYKEAVVEYVLTDNKVISFLITNDYYNIYTKKIDNSFFENINTLKNYNSVNKFGGNNLNDFNNYIKVSNELYEKLFKNFESKIFHHSIVVIPDNQLNLISFETLIKKSVLAEKIDYTDLPYLIKENPISYSYSATMLYDNFDKDIKYSNNKVLALAPEYPNNSDFSGSDNLRNLNLSPLKYTSKEVESISKFFNTKVLLGNNANYSNFVNLSKRYDIVHLAMHADIDDNQPLNSKLIFSNSDSNSSEYKQITVGDIYNMDINSKLLVLSACNTGMGKLRNGEGTLSLARAFMYAGCKSIVMTLWSVEDESSSILMANFYKYLDKGYSKAKALQLAKVEYLKNNPPSKTHPYFWAGFIPVGDQDPISDNKSLGINWAFIFIIAGVGFGLTPIFTNRKIKRSLRRRIRRRMMIK